MRQMLDHEYSKVLELLNNCKDFPCFVFEGMLIKGHKVDLVKRYVTLNPDESFYVWLHDSNLVIPFENV